MSDLSEGMQEVIARLEDSLEELIDITCTDIFTALDSYENVSAEALQQSIRRNMTMAVTSLRAGSVPTPAELDPAATTTTERFHSGVSIDQVIIAFRMSFSLIHSRFIDFSFDQLEAPELVRGPRSSLMSVIRSRSGPCGPSTSSSSTVRWQMPHDGPPPCAMCLQVISHRVRKGWHSRSIRWSPMRRSG